MASSSPLTPLSNDPESLTDFATSIGLDENCFQFSELFSFDEEMFQYIPRPIYSLIFLYPYNDDEGPLEEQHQEAVKLEEPIPWFTRQTVPNSCGTIAVIHSILNNLSSLKVSDDSWLSKFIANAKDKTPDERAELIEGSDDLLDIQEDNANDDDTPLTESSFSNHFITFISLGGKLWELDGLKPQPVCHGECSDLLKDSVALIQKDFLPHIKNQMEVPVCAFCGLS